MSRISFKPSTRLSLLASKLIKYNRSILYNHSPIEAKSLGVYLSLLYEKTSLRTVEPATPGPLQRNIISTGSQVKSDAYNRTSMPRMQS